MAEEVARVAQGESVVKVTVTRGRAGRGYAVPTAVRTTRIVSAHPVSEYPTEWAATGVRVRRCHLVLAQQPRLAGAKTLNRLENVLARSEWDDPAVAEGLIADGEGRVIEGTMSNVFIAASVPLSLSHTCRRSGVMRNSCRFGSSLPPGYQAATNGFQSRSTVARSSYGSSVPSSDANSS